MISKAMKLAVISMVLFESGVAFAGPSAELLRQAASNAKVEEESQSSTWQNEQKQARRIANGRVVIAVEIGDAASSLDSRIDVE